jgi:hypothetical protein
MTKEEKKKKNLAIFLSSTRWGNRNEFNYKGSSISECLFHVKQPDLVSPEKWSWF